MPSIVVIGILTLSSPSARERVITELNKVSEYSRRNELGVTKHSTTVLRDDPEPPSVYVIEEYADQTALDAHMASTAVKSLIGFFESHPDVFAAETVVLTLDPSAGFTGAAVVEKEDPFITFAKLEYKDSKDAELSLQRWKGLRGSVERDEPGTLVYYVCSDKSQKDKVYTIEAYESESYWANDHGKSGAVISNREIDEAEGRTGREILRLKKAGGYLEREGKDNRAVL